MNSDRAMSYATTGTSTPHQFTLNDLRVRPYAAQEQPSNSGLVLSGIVLVGVLAIGAFALLDPLGMFVQSEPKATPPAQTLVPAAEPARPAASQEIVLPMRAPMNETVAGPATAVAKAVETPAIAAPVAKAARGSGLAAKKRSGSKVAEARSKAAAKTDAILQASPEPAVVPPVTPVTPQEQAAAPSGSNQGDEIKDAPRPAAAAAGANSEPAPAQEEAN